MYCTVLYLCCMLASHLNTCGYCNLHDLSFTYVLGGERPSRHVFSVRRALLAGPRAHKRTRAPLPSRATSRRARRSPQFCCFRCCNCKCPDSCRRASLSRKHRHFSVLCLPGPSRWPNIGYVRIISKFTNTSIPHTLYEYILVHTVTRWLSVTRARYTGIDKVTHLAELESCWDMELWFLIQTYA